MDVMNRKLFAQREARNRLRNMGGIMASYPELMQEAQQYQAGGPIAPVRPPYDAPPQLPLSTPQRRFIPNTVPLKPVIKSFREQLLEAARRGVSPQVTQEEMDRGRLDPESEFFDPAALAEELLRLREEGPMTYGSGSMMGGLPEDLPGAGPVPSVRGRDIPETSPAKLMAEELAQSPEIGVSVPEGAEQIFAMSPDQFEDFIQRTPEEQQNILEFGLPDPSKREAFEFEAFRPDPAAPPITFLEAVRRLEEWEQSGPRMMDVVTGTTPLEYGPPRRRQAPGQEPEEGAPEPEQPAAAPEQPAAESAPEAAPRPETTAAPGEEPQVTGEAPPSDDTSFDPGLLPPPGGEDEETLSELYPRRLEEFKRILGTESDKSAQDKAMQLAMIGLAIASGQSPDALTNIAQGALAGLQSMSEQEAKRRSENRELRATALESAMEELDLARRLRSAEKIAGMRATSGGGTYTPERLYQTNIGAILQNPDMFDVFDAEGNAVDPEKVRKLALELSQRGEMLGGAEPSAAVESLSETERRLLGLEE